MFYYKTYKFITFDKYCLKSSKTHQFLHMTTKAGVQKLGLGDLVEKGINKIAPKLAKRAKEKGCNCDKRKEFLNNIGAKFG